MRGEDIVLYIVLAIILIVALYRLQLVGASKGIKKSKHDSDEQEISAKRRGFIIWVMKQFTGVALILGGGVKPHVEFEYKYIIERCEIRVKRLNRYIKPIEIVGIFRLIKFICVLCSLILFIVSFNWFSFLPMWGVFVDKFYMGWNRTKIEAEDEEIEADFPDLYLLLYTRLVKGANARLEPSVREYMNSLDTMYGEGKGHSAIRKFCSTLCANIDIYGDESMAVKKMRDRYRSPTVINFCNLATQALSGVDNSDKLLTFKTELSQARLRAMEQYADNLVRKGERAVYIVYVVLFEFIILSWVSKIDLSMFSQIL